VTVGGPLHHQANLVLRFLLELCALAALFYWGLRIGGGSVVGVILGLGMLVLAALVWGMFASPRARVSLPLAGRLVVELLFFGSAAVGLYATRHPLFGIALFVLAGINRALIQAWGQDESMRTDAGQHTRSG
jgi:hypothetical protein